MNYNLIKDVVYLALQDYQTGKLPHGSECYVAVGLLDEPLTVVYDRICAAIDKEREERA